MKLGIGNDQGGVELKFAIKEHLEAQGYEVVNFGIDDTISVDYPDIAEKVADAVNNHEVDKGILICGTGIGIGMAANKIKGIRCAICSDPYSAKMASEHNDCNMIAIGGRVVGSELGKLIIDTFLTATFEGGRHKRRVDKIMALENKD